jgi:pimeloyl-ACP methyl ester carboxylesterase
MPAIRRGLILWRTVMRTCLVTLTSLALLFGGSAPNPQSADRDQEVPLQGAKEAAPFTGDKTSWHGFDRYDFVMDEDSLAIKPFKAPAEEKNGVQDPPKGQRRCIVVVPKEAAAGKPWSWRGCYWDHQPQAEIELLKRGFHIAYISANATLRPGKQWEAWYSYLTDKHGFSAKPAFVGMSRGGEYAFTWGTMHPDRVACIYADNPGINRDVLGKLGELAKYDVPILQVCGSIDPLLGKGALAIENIYQQFGGRVSLMIKEGAGHHPHSLRDPGPIADFITQSVKEATPATPAYAGRKLTRSAFYSSESLYREFPKEGNYITCRGPLFSECYDRFTFELPGVEGAITVIEPRAPAKGKPWLLRSDHVSRDAAVDLALLSRGFCIVTGPVPYNADGPSLPHWNATYKHLTENGFAKKPVLAGAGGAGGDAYAWAIENPDKVACIYAENPVLRSHLSKKPLLDNLKPLAQAKVPLLHLCGSLDPWLKDHTRVAEQRYQALGGQLTVIVQEGQGHLLRPEQDRARVVEFIMKCVSE